MPKVTLIIKEKEDYPQAQEREGFLCNRCWYWWIPLDINKPPRTCPNKACKSPYWNKKRVIERI